MGFRILDKLSMLPTNAKIGQYKNNCNFKHLILTASSPLVIKLEFVVLPREIFVVSNVKAVTHSTFKGKKIQSNNVSDV